MVIILSRKATLATTAYPGSLLARKTRTLLYELFIKNHGKFLAKGIRNAPKQVRSYRKLTLRKKLFPTATSLWRPSWLFSLTSGGLTLVHDNSPAKSST